MRLELPQLSKVIELGEGGNLLVILKDHQVPIASSCSGEGVCGTCRLQIEGDGLPSVGRLEGKLLAQLPQKTSHSRMACLIEVPIASKTWVLRSTYW